MKVFVYYDVRQQCWSLRRNGRVLNYRGGRKVRLQRVVLRDARFVVGEAGRQRVLRTGHKNVHAGVEGELAYPCQTAGLTRRVRYNPYQAGHFVAEDGSPVYRAGLVLLDHGKVFTE